MRNNSVAARFFMAGWLLVTTVATPANSYQLEQHAITTTDKLTGEQQAEVTTTTAATAHINNAPATIVVPPATNTYRISLAILANYPDDKPNVSQVLQALVKLNRHAFVAGDANKIMADAVVTVPDLAQIKKYPPTSLPRAINAVSRPKINTARAAAPPPPEPVSDNQLPAGSITNNATASATNPATEENYDITTTETTAPAVTTPVVRHAWHLIAARFVMQHSILFVLLLIFSVLAICYRNVNKNKQTHITPKNPQAADNLELDIDNFLATYGQTAATATADADNLTATTSAAANTLTTAMKLRLLQQQLAELVEQTSDEAVKQRLKILLQQLD